jgi:beta-glucosidase-like glycosyl hydrolase
LKAGVDVLLLDDEASSATAYEQLLVAARRGTLSRATLTQANARIATLKRWLARR